MRLPINTTEFKFLALSGAERVLDFDTKQPKADTGGQPLWQVKLCAINGDNSEIISIKISGVPLPINGGDWVNVDNLVASPWDNNGRSGVSYRADKIEPAARLSKAS